MDLTLKKIADLATFTKLFGSAVHSLDHLELRDNYAIDYEGVLWKRWLDAGKSTRLEAEPSPYWDLTTATTTRGVTMRRARVFSTPPTDYTRLLHALGHQGAEHGETLRWLPRDLASDLRLPGNDFWLVDSERVMFNVFDGEGRPTGAQFTDDPTVIELCADAFEAVWSRATPHETYQI
ncbi:MAG: DUF6879 family protein [Streptosporangiaceae bacterium]